MSSKSIMKYPFPPEMLGLKKSMLDFVEKYWFLNRSPVSSDTDRLVEGIAKEISGETIESACGEECLTWQTPQRWDVRRATLKDESGKVIADFKDNPMHLWMHSVSFNGEITRDELMKHIMTDPARPDEIRFHYRNSFKYGLRDWGFSIKHRDLEQSKGDIFHVDISSDLDNNGALKVFNAYLPGIKKDTIFFMAHTCHPAQVADGIANIAVLIELYRILENKENRNYSYRFLFGPEFFGAAAYLAKAPADDIQNLKHGVYCDMLSSHEPIGFQTSFRGDAPIDKALDNLLDSHSNFHIKRGYRKLWGNDETFFNGPGFEIPMAGLGRGMNREYHYDTDNLENADGYHLVESLWILTRLVEMFETNFVPVRTYKGPVYQSRYDLYVDPTKDPNAAEIMEAFQICIDGNKSILEIACELKADYFFIRGIAEKLIERGLVSKI